MTPEDRKRLRELFESEPPFWVDPGKLRELRDVIGPLLDAADERDRLAVCPTCDGDGIMDVTVGYDACGGETYEAVTCAECDGHGISTAAAAFRERDQLRTELAEATAERDEIRTARDNWKHIAARVALRTDEQIVKLRTELAEARAEIELLRGHLGTVVGYLEYEAAQGDGILDEHRDGYLAAMEALAMKGGNK